MDVKFEDSKLDDLEVNPSATAGFSQSVVRGFRKVLQAIRAAEDERDLYALKGLRFEKLKGKRNGQYSLRCNNQYRLIIKISGQSKYKKAHVIELTDYH